ncbi:MAG: hypothetical protein TR69_WS6001000589 [candidate division WS6 bacterium OLB20]|uniref:Uncharacterized protein n=1 Tax=candidate division WS6 bacterium OLB20 TaxID=1617426 RepID=A0A136LY56_9BACT|nr:MAG: hypothetical protein TR69_WS6001000589 [candidate division WS6 bacterium OLB20]
MTKRAVTKKAFGLVEIIIAIAIFGTAMIATVAIAISSLRTVQDNELADTANSVMIGSMEYMKSPAVVPLLTNLPTGQRDFAFRVTGEVNPSNCTGSTGCQLQIVQTTSRTPITTCDSNSEFRVRLSELPNFIMCNQILVNQTDPGVFELRSIVVFFSSRNGMQRTELLGFRNTSGGST